MTPIVFAAILSAIVGAVIAYFWASNRITDKEGAILAGAWLFATFLALRMAGL